MRWITINFGQFAVDDERPISAECGFLGFMLIRNLIFNVSRLEQVMTYIFVLKWSFHLKFPHFKWNERKAWNGKQSLSQCAKEPFFSATVRDGQSEIKDAATKHQIKLKRLKYCENKVNSRSFSLKLKISNQNIVIRN